LGQSDAIDPEVLSIWVAEAEMRDSFACAKGDRAMVKLLEFLSNKNFS
jgi:hypothetical protein